MSIKNYFHKVFCAAKSTQLKGIVAGKLTSQRIKGAVITAAGCQPIEADDFDIILGDVNRLNIEMVK